MGLCYANPPFSQLAKVLTKIAGARVVLCTPVCNFLELGSLGHLILRAFPRGKSGAEVGIVNSRARAGQTFP